MAATARCTRMRVWELFKLITGELLIGVSRPEAPYRMLSLFPAFDHVVTVWRQLTYAYLGKGAKLTIWIFFEVLGVVALAYRLPK